MDEAAEVGGVSRGGVAAGVLCEVEDFGEEGEDTFEVGSFGWFRGGGLGGGGSLADEFP